MPVPRLNVTGAVFFSLSEGKAHTLRPNQREKYVVNPEQQGKSINNGNKFLLHIPKKLAWIRQFTNPDRRQLFCLTETRRSYGSKLLSRPETNTSYQC